jgi:hypothetical protein
MTPSEAISVSCEQKEHWQSEHITARRAWFYLTGRKCLDVEWAHVEAWMIRWLLRKREDEERIAA